MIGVKRLYLSQLSLFKRNSKQKMGLIRRYLTLIWWIKINRQLFAYHLFILIYLASTIPTKTHYD